LDDLKSVFEGSRELPSRTFSMDIVTFTVGNIGMGVPFRRLALSALVSEGRVVIDDTGKGTLDATVQVTDLRRKFGFTTLPSEQAARVISIETDGHLTGLVINRSSPVKIVRDAEVKPPTGTYSPFVTGTATVDGELVFLFDWDALLASDETLDISDVFNKTIVEQEGSDESRFLETIVRESVQFVEQGHTSDVIAALADESKFVVAAVMPAVGASIGPEFGMEPGSDMSGQLVNGLKKAGFDMVFNAGFGHDLAAMETAFELRQRIVSGENLPLIISSCPSLVKQVEHLHPHLIPNLSVNRSPSQMFGRILKTYYAEHLERSPTDITVVQITPCLPSKFERARYELDGVDISVTTREIARLLRTVTGYDLSDLEEMPFDSPFDEVTGGGVLSDVSGGTAEAILRTVGELMTGADIGGASYEAICGTDPVREAEIHVADTTLRVAVTHDLGHGNQVLKRVTDDSTTYHLVEIMACPSGCAGGGGQPSSSDPESVQHVAEMLIQIDQNSAARKPRTNRKLNHIYAEFLNAPFGEKSQDLLQTAYTNRGRY